jgi:hypothetical protein
MMRARVLPDRAAHNDRLPADIETPPLGETHRPLEWRQSHRPIRRRLLGTQGQRGTSRVLDISPGDQPEPWSAVGESCAATAQRRKQGGSVSPRQTRPARRRGESVSPDAGVGADMPASWCRVRPAQGDVGLVQARRRLQHGRSLQAGVPQPGQPQRVQRTRPAPLLLAVSPLVRSSGHVRNSTSVCGDSRPTGRSHSRMALALA